MKRIAYLIFDNDGNPKLDSLRHHRKNSVSSMESEEWKLRQSQGWRCEKIEIEITIITK